MRYTIGAIATSLTLLAACSNGDSPDEPPEPDDPPQATFDQAEATPDQAGPSQSDRDAATEICAEALARGNTPDARRAIPDLITEVDTELEAAELRDLVNEECLDEVQALGATAVEEPSTAEPEPWTPGDADDVFALATGRSTTDGDLNRDGWLAWLDCRNGRPSGFWDHAVTCDLPVEGELVPALYVDWLDAFDDPTLDNSERLVAASLSRGALLETLTESACETNISAVYVAPLLLAHDLVFLYDGYGSEVSYDAADRVVEHVNRAAAIQGIDSHAEVEVLNC